MRLTSHDPLGSKLNTTQTRPGSSPVQKKLNLLAKHPNSSRFWLKSIPIDYFLVSIHLVAILQLVFTNNFNINIVFTKNLVITHFYNQMGQNPNQQF